MKALYVSLIMCWDSAAIAPKHRVRARRSGHGAQGVGDGWGAGRGDQWARRVMASQAALTEAK